MPERTPNKWNNEKPPSWCATNNIDGHSVVLDTANFYCKKSTSPRVFRVFRAAIGKYFLIEKMAFCRYLTFAFMMHKFPGTIFSLSVPIEFL